MHKFNFGNLFDFFLEKIWGSSVWLFIWFYVNAYFEFLQIVLDLWAFCKINFPNDLIVYRCLNDVCEKFLGAEYIHLKVFLGKVLKVLLRLSKTCTLCNAQAFTEIADFPSDWITNSNERYLRFHNKIIWKFSKSSSGYDKCYNTLFHECTIGLTFSTKHSQAFTFFH